MDSLSAENKILCEDDVFYYFIQVTQALHFLSENGLVHGGICPENILMDSNHTVRIGHMRWLQKDPSELEDPKYTAPELRQKGLLKPSVDIWSLGVLLYDLFHRPL